MSFIIYNVKGKDDILKEDNNTDDVDRIIQGKSIPLNNHRIKGNRRKKAIIRYIHNNKEDQEQNIKTTFFLFHLFRN